MLIHTINVKNLTKIFFTIMLCWKIQTFCLNVLSRKLNSSKQKINKHAKRNYLPTNESFCPFKVNKLPAFINDNSVNRKTLYFRGNLSDLIRQQHHIPQWCDVLTPLIYIRVTLLSLFEMLNLCLYSQSCDTNRFAIRFHLPAVCFTTCSLLFRLSSPKCTPKNKNKYTNLNCAMFTVIIDFFEQIQE